MRPEFDQGIDADLEQRPHGTEKANRLTKIADPVLGNEALARKPARGNGRVERYGASAWRNAANIGEQRRTKAGDEMAVTWWTAFHQTAKDLARCQRRSNRVDRRVIAGQYDRTWTVYRANRQPASKCRDLAASLLLREVSQQHAALCNDLLQQPAAPADDASGVREREGACHMRRRDLTHTVPDHCVRHHSP